MAQKRAMPSEKRIVMARVVAERWLTSHVHPEHRLTVYYVGPRDGKGIPNLMRSLRDAKIKLGSDVTPIPDLGIEEAFDNITLWSADNEAMKRLAAWFEKHGYETTGAW